MFDFKGWVAISLFLFGSTFLWMTRDFLADRTAGTGLVWSVVQVLVFAAIIGFTVAAWGVFKGSSWWETAALVSAIVGFATLGLYAVGIFQVGDQGDAGVRVNLLIHVLGLVAVLALVLWPILHTWVEDRM